MSPLSLTLLRGRFAGHSVPLGAHPVVLGREGASIFLESPRASARHAELRAEPQGMVLRDLGSTLGTWVNGARITAHVVSAGDVIEIGDDAFRVEALALPARALLIATKGPLLGRSFPVITAPVVFGRDTDCTIVIASLRASRKHCELLPEATGLMLRDLRSGNGTLVNKERISTRELCPGDLIDVGDEQFRIDPPIGSLPVSATAPTAVGSTLDVVSPQASAVVARVASQVAPSASPPVVAPSHGTVPLPPGGKPIAEASISRARSPLAVSSPVIDTTTVRCPRCGRAVDPRLQDCPWDGAALVNGRTFF